jgi:MEDS: MEthanogen/methylotroph, DcmR Sensory domain
MAAGFEDAVSAPIARSSCPHLAVLIRTEDELLPVLASFYALGLRRNGWLVHRARPEDTAAHRSALEAAGVPVDELEADGRMAIAELDPWAPAEQTAEAWSRELDAALGRGYAAGWYSRSATGPGAAEYERIMAHEAAWDARFHGRPVVTLCPFVVGTLEPDEREARADALTAVHDALLVADGGGGYEERIRRPAR